MEFHPGQRVRIVQSGTLFINGIVLTDNVFEGVTIAGKNRDGTYLVRGMISTPQSDTVAVPANWIEATN